MDISIVAKIKKEKDFFHSIAKAMLLNYLMEKVCCFFQFQIMI